MEAGHTQTGEGVFLILETIAAFDFDGTLTTKDSLRDFLVQTYGQVQFFLGITKNIIPLVGYMAGFVGDHKAKETLFHAFFANRTVDFYQNACNEYSLSKLDRIIRPEAMKKAHWHQTQGHHLVIVSASLADWIKPWAFRNGFRDVIATEAEVLDGVLTGKLATPNCRGGEKVRRFLNHYKDRDRYLLYAYGDSNGDRKLLELADKPFFRSFW